MDHLEGAGTQPYKLSNYTLTDESVMRKYKSIIESDWLVVVFILSIFALEILCDWVHSCSLASPSLAGVCRAPAVLHPSLPLEGRAGALLVDTFPQQGGLGSY